MAAERVLIIASNSDVGNWLEEKILRPAGYEAVFVSDRQVAMDLPSRSEVDLFIIGEVISGQDGLTLASHLSRLYPTVPIIFLTSSDKLNVSLVKHGVWDTIHLPVETESVRASIRRSIELGRKIRESYTSDFRQSTQILHRRLEALEAMQNVGRSVASLLDLDSILAAVVDAAVDMTGAEEGTLLLLDDMTGELYMRAARNFQDDFVRRFRLPIRDSLAGQVMRTGKPLVINANEPQKIKTSYLVHTLIYVPLTVYNRVIGVLGVDNRQSGYPFHEEHLGLVTTLADYASIAIKNARAYQLTDFERKRLETILTKVEDGFLIIDTESRILLANQTVCNIFNLNKDSFIGKPVLDIFLHPDLQDIFEARKQHSYRTEIKLDDGRVYNTQVTAIEEVGTVLSMQDITHLKELDRIKSDFMNTVSHDLRSPLTAILGYVELIERTGPVTEQQREFIHRVRFSVKSITLLINDILELGRIEAGFDTRKEIIQLETVIQLASDRLAGQSKSRGIEIKHESSDVLPSLLGNPTHILQMVENLLNNAIKFSPNGSIVTIRAKPEANQVILQIIDYGIGIPVTDQAFIFDKFFRASNVPQDIAGSGLGLAIVKSIVENHKGRIWVDSRLGQGSIFTVVLPATVHTL